MITGRLGRTCVETFLITIILTGCSVTDDRDPPSGAPGESDDKGSSKNGTDGNANHNGDNTNGTCAEEDFSIAAEPVDMLIVLDRSSSMEMQQLWYPMGEALKKVTEEMSDRINFGLVVYPEVGCPSECGVPAESLVEIGTTDAAIQIATRIGPGGIGTCEASGTPTAGTLEMARDELDALTDSYNRYVLLATDGAPNCNPNLSCQTCTVVHDLGCVGPTHCLDDEAAVAAAGDLKQVGYPVFVLGLGDLAKWWTVMDRIAGAGGTGQHYRADDTKTLVDALESITGQVASCEFRVDWDDLPADASQDPGLVNIYCKEKAGDAIGSHNVIKYANGCTSDIGWHWTDSDTIHLCEGACEKLRSAGCVEITATFGCDSIVI